MRPVKRSIKRNEITIRNKIQVILLFFTDRSFQASQQGTKTQGVTEEEKMRRIEAKEGDTSTTRQKCETLFDE